MIDEDENYVTALISRIESLSECIIESVEEEAFALCAHCENYFCFNNFFGKKMSEIDYHQYIASAYTLLKIMPIALTATVTINKILNFDRSSCHH